MENQQNESKEDQIRAKQAISPAGLSDQTPKGTTRPGSEPDMPELAADANEEQYTDGDQPAGDLHQRHPNRNRDGKADLDKPAYGGSH